MRVLRSPPLFSGAMDMKIFLWTDVLKNYTPGLVVLSAETVEDAWDKVKQTDFRAWFWMQTGISHVYSEEESEWYTDEIDPDWIIPQPIAYGMEDMPVVVLEGGS